MTALPPPDREAAAKVGNECAYDGVGEHGVGDATMACVMGSEHDLMLELIRF